MCRPILVLLCLFATQTATQAAEINPVELAEALDQPERVFATGGQEDWFAQTEIAHDGVDATRSGSIGDQAESWLETTHSGAGIVSFWWKVSSEKGFDFLEFSINGDVQDSISGELDWAQQTYTLDSGEHTLRWRYRKDASVAGGDDAGWLDQLSIEAADETLLVEPEEPWEMTTFASSPFSASKVYTIFHGGAGESGWRVSSTVPWLEFAGMATVDGASELTVRTNSQTAEQPVGVHEGQLIFTDIQTEIAVDRNVVLTVLPRPGQIDVTDSLAPMEDHTLPFGDISLGLTQSATIRIQNTDPENALTIQGVQLRPRFSKEPAPATTQVTAESPEDPEKSDTLSARFDDTEVEVGTDYRQAPGADWSQAYDPATILVRFKKGAKSKARMSAHHMHGGRVTKTMRRIPLDVVSIPPNADPRAMVAAYKKNPNVEYAEPNYKLSIHRSPDDPRFPDQWGLQNTGQSEGLAGADIAALQAWQSTQGNPEIVVAVIDSGIDYNHPDLAANIWINPEPTFGDLHGATWTNGDGTVTSGDPMDDNAHGTHVAGIVGAGGNNGLGVTGVAWNVRLMALKFLDAEGFGSTADAVAALEYAIDQGAHITNNSWGGGGFSQALRDMIAAAGEANQLFITASGNNDSNNDLVPSYPSSFPLDNIISVASSNRNDGRASLSNYGPNTVDLAAPGESVLSTIPGGGYQFFSGTSMAAPHVTGVAALILALNPQENHLELKRAVLDGATRLPDWEPFVGTGGRLSAAGALANMVPDFRLSKLPVFPLTLGPGRSLAFEVAYQPRAAATHEASVLVSSDDLETPALTILLSGTAREDSLEVVEAENLNSTGLVGGPFSPAETNYTLRNNGSDAVQWRAPTSVPWLSSDPASGDLAAGAELAVQVKINAAADAFPEGLRSGSVVFTNDDTGLAQTRTVGLRILPWPGQLLAADSISPNDDQLLPFGSILPGGESTETVTVSNAHPSNDLIIEDLLLLGGYREDFGGPNLFGWSQKPVEAWTLNESSYQAEKPDVSLFMQSFHTDEVWSNATFETELTRQGNNSSAAALILRASDDFNLDTGTGSALVIGISGNNFYFIARFINGRFNWVQPWTESSSLNLGGLANRLVASLRDDQLHLFANDELLWSGKTGGPFRPGHFGLAGFTDRASVTTHRFAYVDVREPLTEGTLPPSLSQSWRNRHPVESDDYTALLAPTPVEPMPTDKETDVEAFTYTDVLNRQASFRLLNPPPLPLRLAPGQTADLSLLFNPSGEGEFTRTLRIISNDPDQPAADFLLSGSSRIDPLAIAPLGSFVARGEIGGPFTPATATFVLDNNGDQPIDWEIANHPSWLAVSKSGGSLEPETFTNFTLSVTPAADELPRRLHTAAIEIVNTQTGFARSIPVVLDVQPTLCESLKACGLVWTTGGNVPWSGQHRTTFRTDIAAQSGLVDDLESSWIETTVEGPGEISFWWSVSSELNFDFLEFRTNGELQQSISGETSWENIAIKLPEGQHALRWQYSKDWLLAGGEDAGWLDEVTWTPTPPTPLIKTKENVAFGLVNVGESSQQTLTIHNPGDSTLAISGISFPAEFSGDWETATIPPEESLDLVLTFAPTLVGPQSGTLEIASNTASGLHPIQLTGSGAPAGDALEMQREQILTGLTGEAGARYHFYLQVPPARDELEIRIDGGTGDADLYVRHNTPPTLQESDRAPLLVGNDETVLITDPAPGDWYFMIHAYEDFADVSLRVRFAELHLGSWADWLGLPADERELTDRHGPLQTTTLTGYAFGRDPRTLSQADLPRIERSSEVPGQVRLIYHVHVAASEISFVIETSNDLANWEAATPASDTVLSTSDGVEIREAIFDRDESSALFIRAKIDYEPTP